MKSQFSGTGGVIMDDGRIKCCQSLNEKLLARTHNQLVLHDQRMMCPPLRINSWWLLLYSWHGIFLTCLSYFSCGRVGWGIVRVAFPFLTAKSEVQICHHLLRLESVRTASWTSPLVPLESFHVENVTVRLLLKRLNLFSIYARTASRPVSGRFAVLTSSTAYFNYCCRLIIEALFNVYVL